MQFKSIKCPNCGGPAREMGDGKFVCESCGTSFMADYDKEDVEYVKAKAFAEREKMRSERQKAGIEMVQNIQRKPRMARAIVISISMIFCSIIVCNVIIFSIAGKMHSGMSASYEQSRQNAEERASRERESLEAEWNSRQEEAQRAFEESKAIKLASYRVTPDELLSDEFFVENATASLLKGLEGNTTLYWANWVWNEEPEYLTSYLLIAKDESEFDQNYVVSIYRVHWDKEFENRTDKYVMYDMVCLKNVTMGEDGAIRSDYNPQEFTYHNEIVANQFLSGYSDYDQLIRQEIYGNPDYGFEEFQFPGAVE